MIGYVNSGRKIIWTIVVFVIGGILCDATYASNPVCKVTITTAKRDLLQSLSERYPGSYSVQKTLLNTGLNAYRELCAIPSTPESDAVAQGAILCVPARAQHNWESGGTRESDC